MPHSNDHVEAEGFRSDAEMLSVVVARAEQAMVARQRGRHMVTGGLVVLVAAALAGGLFVTQNHDGQQRPAMQVEAVDSATMPTEDSGNNSSDLTTTTLNRDPLPDDAAPEGWRPMADSPLSPRSNAVSAWTGTGLLVWGGEGETTDVCRPGADGVLLCGDQARSDGAAYDPMHDTWRAMAASPLPPEMGTWFNYEGVWTGSELVVWGGPEGVGAAYDPESDSWRSISAAPLTRRAHFAMDWTGTEVVIVGGSSRPGDPALPGPEMTVPAAAYDPATDTWRELPPTRRRMMSAATVANDRLYVAGPPSSEDDGFLEALDLTDPSAGWTDLGGPSLSGAPSVVFTGNSLVVAGNETRTDPTTGEVMWPLVPRLASFDLNSLTWQDLGEVPQGHEVDQLLWTGREVLVLSASSLPQGGAQQMWAIDPMIGDWGEAPRSSLDDVAGTAAAWTGTELLVWAGAWNHPLGSEPSDQGARYSPGPGR